MRVSTLLVPKMASPTTILLLVWMAIVCCIQFTWCLPTTETISSTSSNSTSSVVTVIGVNPKTTAILPTIVTSPSTTSRSATKLLSPKRRGKRIRKVNPNKKPPKDKENWAKQQIAATPIPIGYDVAKGIFSHHKEAPPTTIINNGVGTTPTPAPTTSATTITSPSSTSHIDTVVDNVNGSKDYNNKNRTNSSTLRHAIPHDATTQSVFTNVHVDDDDAHDSKDIDFISVAGTTKADKTYETPSTTEPYHAGVDGNTETAGAGAEAIGKAMASSVPVVVTQASTTTLQTGRMENLDFNAKSNARTTSPGHPFGITTTIPDTTKSIPSSSPRATLIPRHDKSLPVNASPSSSLSLSFSQHNIETWSMNPTTTIPSSTSSSSSDVAPALLPKLDVGHDGVKVTKKKQLFDKHFIAVTTSTPQPSSGSLHSPIARDNDRDRDNPWPLSKTKPTKGGKKLMEVPNGYLGPIMMKEKTFSVSHHGKKLKPSLAEQLKDKKLVEIIAPTALMEPAPKVKSSVTLLSAPEFIPIEGSSPPTTTTTMRTSTESTSAEVTYPTSVSMKEDIESETATTYFLVVTDDPKIHKERIIGKNEMDLKEGTTKDLEIATDSTLMPHDQLAPKGVSHLSSDLPLITEDTTQVPSTSTLETPKHMITDHDLNLNPKVIDQQSSTILNPNTETSAIVDHELSTTDPQTMDKKASTTAPENLPTISTLITEGYKHDHMDDRGQYHSQDQRITHRSSTFAPHDSSVSSDHSLPTIPDLVSTTSLITQTDLHDESFSTSTNRNPSSTLTPDSIPTFATITADLDHSLSSTSRPSLKPTYDAEKTESKISDIQVEVYDSTVEPILASTNFKDTFHAHYPHSHITTKQIPSNNQPQERFTQYVVDKATDFATQDSNTVAKTSGKPEPAAIEIHINVSEGFGNESEDLEFSYRQSDYRKASSEKPGTTNFITLKPFDTLPQNETSNEAAEEIVVEIIDSNSNSTENSASRENLNVNPIFTFRTDDSSQVELKNVKYYPEDKVKTAGSRSDDFFVPLVGQKPQSVNKPLADRDSDTIFYISNTEVKVGESLPTTNTYDAQLKKSRLESQFFPASYDERKKIAPQRYEEDIILSPLKNSIADPLKVRGPLDISYVGESILAAEQATQTTTIPPHVPSSTPDVIIQPAVLPEMAMGVPVIGELPPQIELKEIDFMPNFDGNKEESSIQYGGDLIDEGGAMSAGFDMDSYPLGNMGMGGGSKSNIIASHSLLNHRVNHLKKDELSADLAASSETTDGANLLRRSNESINGTVTGERIGNATAYSVMEEPPSGDRLLNFSDVHMLLIACLSTLLPLVLSIFLAFGLRHLYRKYHSNPFNMMGRNSSTDPLDVEKGAGDADEVQTPEELCASSLASLANTTNPPPSTNQIRPDPSRHMNAKPSGYDTGGMLDRDCNGSIAHDRSSSDTNINGIQTIARDEVEARRTLPPTPAKTQAQAQAQSSIQTSSSNGVATSVTPPTIPQAGTAGAGGTMHCNYSGANGSITTMTLKNNHLIVETEERNDISRDARETKMHYNNSEKDGVFVVEVSRGADSKCMPSSPVDEQPSFNFDAAAKAAKNHVQEKASSHEAVQVHPPPVDSVSANGDVESNHLHQIDEVDESAEDGPKFNKHSNTGLSQSDLSSTSSMDSNKRYSYGNQELYTIEQQDYTTPSQAATKAPHPPQPRQPENHNDDNGHSENGHCLENDDPPTTPNCDTSNHVGTESDADADADAGPNDVESKPKITAALLKQDTVICNDMTNGTIHNGISDEDDATPHNSMEDLSNDQSNIMKVFNTTIVDFPDTDVENGFDSIISLPDPPSTDEIKQMNDIILLETNQLDSLPPPPPPTAENNNNNNNNHHQHNGNGNGNGTMVVDQNGDDEDGGDSNSIVSGPSPMNTPTKLVMMTTPPTITVATVLPPTDIPHTNGNCMTGHATNASTAAVVEVSGSS